MTATIEAPVLSAGRRQDIEDKLTKLGLTWRFNADGDIADIDMRKSLANQARLGERVNEERVETYAEAIKHGAKMPAVVVDMTNRRRKAILMDGVHRILGSEKAGYNIFARYEVTDGDPAAVTLFTFTANVEHGLPNSLEDRIEHAIWLINNVMRPRATPVMRGTHRLSMEVSMTRPLTPDDFWHRVQFGLRPSDCAIYAGPGERTKSG